MKVKFTILLFVFILMGSFQNCGQNFESAQLSSLKLDPEIDPIDPVSREESNNEVLLSNVYNLKLWNDLPNFYTYMVEDLSDNSPVLVFSEDPIEIKSSTFTASENKADSLKMRLKLSELADYTDFRAKIFESAQDSEVEAAAVYLLSNDKKAILLLNLFNNQVDPLWEVELPSPITDNDFNESTITRGDGLGEMSLGLIRIRSLATNTPSAIELPLCQSNEHYENDLCVNSLQSCTIENGSGLSMWNGSFYGECTVESCLEGYKQEGNSCVLDCTAEEHIEGNACVNNIRACAITNGIGQQSWNLESYNACQPTECLEGFENVGNTCQAIEPAPEPTPELEPEPIEEVF